MTKICSIHICHVRLRYIIILNICVEKLALGVKELREEKKSCALKQLSEAEQLIYCQLSKCLQRDYGIPISSIKFFACQVFDILLSLVIVNVIGNCPEIGQLDYQQSVCNIFLGNHSKNMFANLLQFSRVKKGECGKISNISKYNLLLRLQNCSATVLHFFTDFEIFLASHQAKYGICIKKYK